MTTLRIPMSGLMLVSHLAAYGLGAMLETGGEQALVGHDPDSLEMEPLVETDVEPARVWERIRESANACEEAVSADLAPGKPRNDQQPVICARLATNVKRAQEAMPLREALLDRVEEAGDGLAAGLVAGLGAPAVWLPRGKPSEGASGLDGVSGNRTSDFVRGVLRNALPTVAGVSDAELRTILGGEGAVATLSDDERDKTGWAPPGTRVHRVDQWLAALGLCLLPVGLSARGSARTPGMWRDGADAGVRLPVLKAPATTERLRALLQLPELTVAELTPAHAARLRKLGVRELVAFRVVREENKKMTAFSFGRGERIEL